MIGVDTNVVIRHLVRDDDVQARMAHAFLAKRSPDDPAFISSAVLVEVVGVLTSRYRVDRADLHRMVTALLAAREVLIEAAPSVRRALRDAEHSGVDLIDAIIAHAAIDAGCDGIVTFDKRALSLPGMLPLS